MLKNFESICINLLLIGIFYVGYNNDILLIKGFFWAIFILIFVLGITVYILKIAIKENKIPIKNKIKPIPIYKKILGFLWYSSYVGISYMFNSYNMLSMIILSYVTVYFCTNGLIKYLNQERNINV